MRSGIFFLVALIVAAIAYDDILAEWERMQR